MERDKPSRRPVVEVMDDDMARVIRAKSGEERLRIASGLYSSARRLLIGYLRGKYPDWDESRIIREAARRMSHGAF